MGFLFMFLYGWDWIYTVVLFILLEYKFIVLHLWTWMFVEKLNKRVYEKNWDAKRNSSVYFVEKVIEIRGRIVHIAWFVVFKYAF
jgi:hypothetical protein